MMAATARMATVERTHKKDLKATTFRLTLDARRMLAALAEKKGLSMTGVLEVVIRKDAKEEGV